MALALAKFGGTSMASAEVALRSAQVLRQRPEIRMCVISATSGTTNALLRMAQQAGRGEFPQLELDAFESRHQKFMAELQGPLEHVTGYCLRVKEILHGMQLLREVSPSALDDLLSHGELISSRLFEQALHHHRLNPVWVDARHLMKTNSEHGRAKPLLDLIKQHAENELRPHFARHVVVTQGYIGSDLQGRTTTLGKEGSDYSTALFAEALEATEIQIWKDVPGVMTTDPRLCEKARTLAAISFAEVSELTRFGAKVIHPDTFLPAQRAGIPVYVGYSQDPTVRGTRIEADAKTQKGVLKAVSLKRDQRWLRVSPPVGESSDDFPLRVWQLLQQHRIYPTLSLTNEGQLGFIVDKLASLSEDFLHVLRGFAQVELTEGELVALIGHGVAESAQLYSALGAALEQEKPFLITGGASRHSLCLLVNPDQGEALVRRLHAAHLEQA